MIFFYPQFSFLTSLFAGAIQAINHKIIFIAGISGQIDSEPGKYYPYIFALLIITIVALSFFLLRSAKRIQNFENKLMEKTADFELEHKKFSDMLNRNNDLKEVLESQLQQIKELKTKLNSLDGKVDEEVLKRTSELHTLLEKTVESNRLKEAFLEKISRELRTPLNSILGFVNLLNDPNLAKIEREYYLKFIRDSGNNLLTLIDNIIDFSRLETGELVIEPKQCNLSVLLSDLIDKYRTRVMREKPQITIIFNKPEEEKLQWIDGRRVLHVIDQLINNAVKYTNQGKIELEYTIENGWHRFVVSDTGIGIDTIYQDIIFERFYQIESDTKEMIHGAGLGLTIAKGITEMLGGKISLKSEQENGCEFTVLIPCKDIPVSQNESIGKSNAIDWSSKTILVAEDEDSNYHFLEALLRKTKVNLLWAPDGVKFLELMNQYKNIDLVLLDIKMPGINGINAIKVIRQQNINIPVIAQTAFNQPEDKQRCLDSGCNDYLSKPIDRDLLFSKISKYFVN